MTGVGRGIALVSLRERDAERVALEEAARRGAAGAGGLVTIRAAAGLGKTRLLDVAQAAAAAAGLEVLRTSGDELERSLPFGAVIDLLVPRLAACSPQERELLFREGAQAAGPLLEGHDLAGRSSSEERQMELIRALHWVVLHLAERRPLALLLDDIHWLDDVSVRWLVYLSRRIGDRSVLIVATMRPAEPGAAQRSLDALDAAAGGRLRPQRLTARATVEMVAELIGAVPEPQFAAACWQATDGSPLLIGYLARALHEVRVQGSDAETAVVRRLGPRPIARRLNRTLQRLDGGVDVARAIAVLGPQEDVGLVATVAGVAPDVAREVIERLQEAEILADTSAVQFQHPLVRRAVYGEMPASVRGARHQQAAQVLCERGMFERAATHLMLAPAQAEPWAVAVLQGMAERALRRGAPGESVRLLRRALSEPPGPEQLASVLADLAIAEAAAGEDAAERFRAAADAAADRAGKAELLLRLAWAHQSRRRFGDAVRASAEGLELGAGTPYVVQELAAMHDAALLWTPASDSAKRRSPVRVAPPPGAPASHGARVLLADRARRMMFDGVDHVAAAELARQAWGEGAMLAESGAEDPAAIRVLTVLHNADALDEALAVAEACLADAARRNLRMTATTWRHLRGHVLAYLGRLEEAEADLGEAFAARLDGWGEWLPVNAGALAYVLIERDELDGAVETVAAARAANVHPSASPMWAFADGALGRVRLRRRDYAAALDVLLDVGRRALDELGTGNPALTPWRSDAVLALLGLGSTDEAAALAERDAVAAAGWGSPRALGVSLRTRGLISSGAERLELLTRSVEILAPSQARLEHLHALLELGVAQREIDPAAARVTLREALDLAERCGALAVARDAHREVVAAGGRPRRRRLTGLQSLTEGERRVARLVASGLSNRQVADQLVVTPAAVAYHLSNAYRKLEVKGRKELADRIKAMND